MCSNYFLKETYGSQTVEYYRYMTSKLLIKLNLKSLSLSIWFNVLTTLFNNMPTDKSGQFYGALTCLMAGPAETNKLNPLFTSWQIL